MSLWYLLRGDKPLGPYADELIEDMIKAKEVDLIDVIAKEGETQWSIVSDRPEFSELFVKNVEDVSQNEQWVLLKKVNQEWSQYGPLEPLQIKTLIKHGKVKYSDWLWKPGFKRWYQVYTLSEFTSKDLAQEEEGDQLKARDKNKLLSDVFFMEAPELSSAYGVAPVSNNKAKDLTKVDLENHKIKSIKAPVGLPINKNQLGKGVKLNDISAAPVTETKVSPLAETIALKKKINWFSVVMLFAAVFVLGGLVKLYNSKTKPEPETKISKQATFLGVKLENLDKENASIKVATDGKMAMMSLRSVAGNNLNKKSYMLIKDLKKQEIIFLDNYKLKPGFYWLDVVADSKRHKEIFFYGVKNKEFLSNLWQHNKMMAAYHQDEKMAMVSDLEELKKSLLALEGHYKKLTSKKLTSKKLTSKKLASNKLTKEEFFKTVTEAWRPRLTSVLSGYLSKWSPSKANEYTYPELWKNINSFYGEVLKVSENYTAKSSAVLMRRHEKLYKKVSGLHLRSLK